VDNEHVYSHKAAQKKKERTAQKTAVYSPEIFTRTYTDIHKYWNYLLMFSFVHN